MAYKVLEAGEKGRGYNSDAFYTVPAGKSAVISKVIICANSNGGGSYCSAEIWLVSTKTDSNSHKMYNVTLQPGESFELTGGIALAAAEGLWVYLDSESVSAQMTAAIFGDEI